MYNIMRLAAVALAITALAPAGWAQQQQPEVLRAQSEVLIDSPGPNTITGHGHFYVLEAFGGVHAGGGAPAISPLTPYFGFDVAEDIEYFPSDASGSAGILVLDKLGGVHPGGGLAASPPLGPTPYFGFDAARAIVRRDNRPQMLAANVQPNGLNVGADVGLTSSIREGTGRYLLTWERSLAGCAWTLTLGVASNQSFSGHAPLPGLVSARLASAGGPPFSQLRVSTMNPSGALTDQWFHVGIVCPRS